jgi:EAL domain-containing protein (putative c-di-GMP-specific phosphodiesterase class I)
MYTAEAPSVTDPQLSRLLTLARTHLGMDVAWLSVFAADEQVIVAADGALAEMNVTVGENMQLAGSLCTRVLAGTLPAVVTDARRHPVARDLPGTRELNIGSYVGAPWRAADGSVGGMLCCLNRTAAPGLDEHAVRYLSLLADLVSDHLASPATQARRDALTAVRSVLEAAAIRTVFQPVVALADRTVIAHEALSRFDEAVFTGPEHAFATAARCGLGAELELLAAERALETRGPSGGWLGINLSAETLLTPRARELLLAHAGRGLAVEITEHTPVPDYDRLNDHLRPLRAAGIRVAVDDAGAGFAGLQHILQLRPDTIKLDIALVRDIDQDPVRRALSRSLVAFADEVGATLVAEGVETAGEASTLAELGVRYGQGFLLGRPE